MQVTEKLVRGLFLSFFAVLEDAKLRRLEIVESLQLFFSHYEALFWLVFESFFYTFGENKK